MKLLRHPDDWNRGAIGLSADDFTEGLLFLMHKAATWPVLMDGVLIPLDVYWLSETGMVLEHAELFPGLPAYWPDCIAKYVLELPMRESPAYKVGDFIEGTGMTRSQIRDRILSASNESTSAPVFWTTAQVDAIIEEASEVLAEEAKAIRRSAFVARQAGATYYSIRGVASDIMAITRVWLPDQNKRLTAVSLAELDGQNETWPLATGDPEYWFPISWDCFGLYPHPVTGGGVLRVDYVAWPRPLLDDDDEPEFREADQDSLVMYGLYDGLLKQWNVPRATELFQRFLGQQRIGQARNGVRECQARVHQRPLAPGYPFQSGVTQ